MPDDPTLFLQDGRLLTVDTPLGKDVFLLESMSGEEGICRPFAFELGVRSMRGDIQPRELLGKPITFSLELPGSGRRNWSGIVSDLSAGEAQSVGQRAYRLTVRPWFWMLTRHSDCRIFQNQTTLQIMETIFGELGFADYDFSAVTEKPGKRHYCVQYNETSYAFICRLLEEEGIAWWFRHPGTAGTADGRHVLVLSDGTQGWKTGDEPVLRFTTTNLDLHDVTSWHRRWSFVTGRLTESDWNFKTPRTDLTSGVASLAPIDTNSGLETYRWHGRFPDRDRGDKRARRRMQAIEAGFEVIEGGSANRRVHPGQRFTLRGHPAESENVAWAVISVRHAAQDLTYVTGTTAPPVYSNSFSVISAETPYTPPLVTPRPHIDGVQIATVVGPKGEEIHTDSMGRVKVRFPWDRRAKGDDTSSCWLRVSQPWAGGKFGSQTIPRIGMEVLVSFVEGDPDRPVVVGLVPNSDTSPSLDLPANKTRTAFRTNSSPGGSGFNELAFEDKAGAEELLMLAQRDASEVVKNNKRVRVNNVSTHEATTLKLDKVGHSEIIETPEAIVIQHRQSRIVLTENGIQIAFKDGHYIQISDQGIEVVSNAQVVASTMDQASAIVINKDGIDEVGPIIALNCQAPGEGGSGTASDTQGASADASTGAGSAAPAAAAPGQAPPGAKQESPLSLKGTQGTSTGPLDGKKDKKEIKGEATLGKAEGEVAKYSYDDGSNSAKATALAGKAELKSGVSYDKDKKEWSADLVKGELSGSVAAGEAEHKFGNSGSVKAAGEALSAKAEAGIGISKSPDKFKAGASAGAEANLVKGSLEGMVNVTPKTIYDNSVGRAVDAIYPGSPYAKAPDYLDHGLVLGAQGEAGIGAAAKASADIIKDQAGARMELGAKLGAGPMAGVKAILGVK